MISKKIKDVMQSGSAIRAMFEEGKRLAQITAKKMYTTFLSEIPAYPRPRQSTRQSSKSLRIQTLSLCTAICSTADLRA